MSKKDDEFCWKDSVTLKTYFDKRLDDLNEKIDLHFKLSSKAVDEANNTLNIRLESMNEFRAQMKDQTANYLTRSEYEGKHEGLVNQIQGLQKFMWMALGALTVIEILFKFFIK